MINVPADAYGPVVLTGDGRSLRPGDEGFEEAQATAVKYEPPPLDLANMTVIGWAWGDFDVVLHADGSGEMRAEHWVTPDPEEG